MTRILGTILLSLLALTGCAQASAPAVHVTASTVVIDVRTAGEYAAGHLEGAVNIDVQSSDFGTAIAALPKDGDYVVYCASGHRAGIAIEKMAAVGFTTLANAGGLSDASAATGLPIVTG